MSLFFFPHPHMWTVATGSLHDSTLYCYLYQESEFQSCYVPAWADESLTVTALLLKWGRLYVSPIACCVISGNHWSGFVSSPETHVLFSCLTVNTALLNGIVGIGGLYNHSPAILVFSLPYPCLRWGMASPAWGHPARPPINPTGDTCLLAAAW